jgi:hypothetical protein
VAGVGWENGGVGLGGGPSEWDDYEWVRLSDLPPAAPPGGRRWTRGVDAEAPAGSLAAAVRAVLLGASGWADGVGPRVLLVDLDNLRAGPVRWRRRMEMVVSLAREADHAAFAGQQDAVRRARPYLAEFAASAQAVADGSDLADHVLLDAADEVPGRTAQFAVISNDGIFATLARRGVLTVLSPGGDALSDRLRTAAAEVIDLAALEKATPARASRVAPTSRTRRRASAVA